MLRLGVEMHLRIILSHSRSTRTHLRYETLELATLALTQTLCTAAPIHCHLRRRGQSSLTLVKLR